MSLDVAIQKTVKSRMKGQDFSLEMKFQVASGEVLGLFGPSGCGKSMTLKCIAGIMQANCGKITLNESLLYDSEKEVMLPPRLRKIGYMFQSYALFPHMTVQQNVSCGIRREVKEPYAAWKKRLKKICNYYLELLQVASLSHRYPHQLSGGQQQRVALARILASEPYAILLDEPFSALDASLKNSIEPELKAALAMIGCPVILVTHDFREVQRYCSRWLPMESGRIQQENTL